MKEMNFKKKAFGYEMESVDRFLDKIMVDYQAGSAENERLEAEVQRLKMENQRLRDTATQDGDFSIQKQAAGQALVEAEILAASKVAEAKAEAEEIVEIAQRKAKQILAGQAVVEAERAAANKISTAKVEADQIIAHAQAEAELIIEDGKAELDKTLATRQKIIDNIVSSLDYLLLKQEGEVGSSRLQSGNFLNYQAGSDK